MPIANIKAIIFRKLVLTLNNFNRHDESDSRHSGINFSIVTFCLDVSFALRKFNYHPCNIRISFISPLVRSSRFYFPSNSRQFSISLVIVLGFPTGKSIVILNWSQFKKKTMLLELILIIIEVLYYIKNSQANNRRKKIQFAWNYAFLSEGERMKIVRISSWTYKARKK